MVVNITSIIPVAAMPKKQLSWVPSGCVRVIVCVKWVMNMLNICHKGMLDLPLHSDTHVAHASLPCTTAGATTVIVTMGEPALMSFLLLR